MAVVDMAAEAEVMAAAISAAVDTLAEVHISAVAAVAARILAERASAPGLGYRDLPRRPVSALTARLRSTAVRTGPPSGR
jgi:hypothetical protein